MPNGTYGGVSRLINVLFLVILLRIQYIFQINLLPLLAK